MVPPNEIIGARTGRVSRLSSHLCLPPAAGMAKPRNLELFIIIIITVVIGIGIAIVNHHHHR